MTRPKFPKPIRAELSGDFDCTAEGLAVTANAPVLEMCKRLIAARYDLDLPMEVYRGDVLALRIRSIGEAASLEVNSKGTDFVKRRQRVRTAPSVRQNRLAAVCHRPDRARARVATVLQKALMRDADGNASGLWRQ